MVQVMIIQPNDVHEYIKRCKELAIGCFVGRKLPFIMIWNTIKRVWKLNGDMQITIHGKFVYVFKFGCEENKIRAPELGAFHGRLIVSGSSLDSIVGTLRLLN